MTDHDNASDGANPASDIKAQNPTGTTTEDIAHGTGQSRAGVSEGADAHEDGSAKDESEQGGGDTKTQDRAKAGRDGMDPNAGQE